MTGLADQQRKRARHAIRSVRLWEGRSHEDGRAGVDVQEGKIRSL